MGRQMIKRIANGHLVWDEEKKKSLLISNYEATKHDKEQSTTKKEPAADKAKEKPKQKNTKTETKKDETTDGE
ncbi:hypothetical protein [Bacillus subtilis]|uniref:hypothetical protein n=1 Tax=Bacillus subtilis TaxID=1423 RepID=UPI001B98F3C1|nr:hypothetical protein [Bacillus subtilis]CAF1718436.1 hypothetical protein NRS6103_00170 [Bacillus subtilis]CAI6301308.1 hypothetical protein NRS6103_16030 [Bacillus subtilis]